VPRYYSYALANVKAILHSAIGIIIFNPYKLNKKKITYCFLSNVCI